MYLNEDKSKSFNLPAALHYSETKYLSQPLVLLQKGKAAALRKLWVFRIIDVRQLVKSTINNKKGEAILGSDNNVQYVI